MLLDENTQDLRELSAYLSPPFIVLSCARWAKALDILKVYQPVGLILDPTMSGLNANDFIHQARNLAQCSSLAVVGAVSTFSSLDQVNQVYKWGVDWAMSKPVNPQTVVKRIGESLAVKRQNNRLDICRIGV